jgi:hypothetical protein
LWLLPLIHAPACAHLQARSSTHKRKRLEMLGVLGLPAAKMQHHQAFRAAFMTGF